MFGAWWLSVALGLDPLLAIVPIALVMYGVRACSSTAMLMRRVQGGDTFTQIFATIGLLFLLQNGVVAGFTSDYRFVNDSLPGPAERRQASRSAASRFGVPLLLAAGLRAGPLPRPLSADRAHGVRPGAAGHQRGPRRRRLVGIRPQRMFAVAWGLGAALVAIAGAILVNFFAVYPQVGLQFTVLAYAIVALGGFGSILGTLFAALLVGVIQSVTVVYLPPGLQGRVRLRVVSPDRAVPAAGPVRPVLVERAERGVAAGRASCGPSGAPAWLACRRKLAPSPARFGPPIPRRGLGRGQLESSAARSPDSALERRRRLAMMARPTAGTTPTPPRHHAPHADHDCERGSRW